MNVTDFMPWWVPWLGPAVYTAAGLLWLMLIPAVPLRKLRRQLGATELWPERAALGWEGRILIGASMLMWVPAAVGQQALFAGPFSAIDPWHMYLAFGLAAVFWALYKGWRFSGSDLAQPLPGFGRHLNEVARRWWPFLMLLLISIFAPARLASWLMIPWTLLALAGLLATRYLAEMWVWSGIAHPGDQRLDRLVESAASRLDSPVPRSFVLQTRAANALALPTRNLVIFTSRMVDLLDDDELEAIALHEIAHLNERTSVSRVRTLGVLAYLPIMAIKPLLGQGIVYLAAGLLVTVGISALVKKVSAAEEQRADEDAVESSHESTAFGTALLKSHEAALIPSIVTGDPHGPLHERLERAGVPPDFEPVQPKRRIGRVIVPMLVYFVFLFVVAIGVRALVNDWDGGTGSHIAIAFGWDDEQILASIGESAAWEGDYERALPYLEEAAALDDYYAKATLPWVLGSAGRCSDVPEAYRALAESNPRPDDLASAERWLAYCGAIDPENLDTG